MHCRLASGLGSGQGSSAEAAVGGRRHARLDFGDRHVSQSPHFTAFGRTIHIARSAFRWRLCNHANVKKHQPRYDYGKGICGKRTLPGRNIGPPWPITFTWSDSFSASFYPTNRRKTRWRGYSGLKTPLGSTQKFLRRDVDGGGGGATRPSAALAPSAPAAHRLLMRCSRAARSMSRASARSQRCCGLRPQRPLAARPSAALAPSAPAGTCIGMRLSRAGQSHLARLLARKPWTPRAFRAKTM